MKSIGMLALALTAHGASFEVASVKRSADKQGIDYRGRVNLSTGRVTGRNVTLQDLIATAYRVQLAQVSSNLKWLDSDEFDIDARGDGDVRPMLQTLLTERFHLALSRKTKEMRAYALVVDKGGPRLQSAKGAEHFHGTMQQFADLLGVQATIAAPVDPASPAMAIRTPILVIDKTDLEGVYGITVDLPPEQGTDRFTGWQRALKEQLGLRLESQRVKVEVLAVTGADRVPSTNLTAALSNRNHKLERGFHL